MHIFTDQRSKHSNLTQVFFPLPHGVILFLTAVDLLVLLHQHALQAGPEKCRNTNRFLSSGAIHNDGVQTSETFAFQQRYQCLQR